MLSKKVKLRIALNRSKRRRRLYRCISVTLAEMDHSVGYRQGSFPKYYMSSSKGLEHGDRVVRTSEEVVR